MFIREEVKLILKQLTQDLKNRPHTFRIQETFDTAGKRAILDTKTSATYRFENRKDCGIQSPLRIKFNYWEGWYFYFLFRHLEKYIKREEANKNLEEVRKFVNSTKRVVYNEQKKILKNGQ